MKTYPDIDLHIHSKYSDDGELDIQTIVEKCIKNNVATFTISDHDRVVGNDEALKLAAEYSLNFIPGIEISCNFNGIDLHLLGFNISYRSSDFEQLDAAITKQTMDSFSEMVANLHKLSFMIDEKDVLDKANGKVPTPELIAEVMLADKKYATEKLRPYMAGGERSDMPYINFYLDYFAQNKPAYVKIDYMNFADAIALVKDNGGTPIVAHPGLNLKGKEELIEDLLNNGAAGMEAFNNYHTDEQAAYFAELAQKRSATITCGSDFHGKTKPLIDVGRYKFNKKYYDYLINSVARLRVV